METESVVDESFEDRLNRLRSAHWHQCGPDLSVCIQTQEQQMKELMIKHGEVRFRYAAHLTESLGLKERPNDWLRMIDLACKERWLSAYAMQRIGPILGKCSGAARVTRIPIPWIDHHVPKATARQKRFAEQVSAVEDDPERNLFPLRDFLYPSAGEESYPEWEFMTVGRVRYELHPNLRKDTVLAWLCFVVEGDRDPQLQMAHAKFQPHKHLKRYRAYELAWRNISG